MAIDPCKLRLAIIRSLKQQGFGVRGGVVYLPASATKEDLRRLHSLAVQRKRTVSEPCLRPYEQRLLNRIANGYEVIPQRIRPKLVYVEPDSEEELLFRYATLHWSVPVSSGYGRRLRFLVLDENNGKLIGLFGLGDPVYSINARDCWIGWDAKWKRDRLYHAMDAYVVGAVPPYSNLLCGKLVALLALSNEVRDAFRRRYEGQSSRIRRKRHQPYLALLTTTSALGRSSVYNRLRIDGIKYWTSLGFTRGFGEFQFSNGLYSDIKLFASENCEPTARHPRWGAGFRNKHEVVKKSLPKLGLKTSLIHHGVQREIFAAPLGAKALEFLRGETEQPHSYDWPSERLASMFLSRWLIPRARGSPDFSSFSRESYRLWPVTNRA